MTPGKAINGRPHAGSLRMAPLMGTAVRAVCCGVCGVALRSGIIALALFASCPAAGEVFAWKHETSGSEAPPAKPTWNLFGSASNWAVGTDKTGTNPDSLVPGANDYIFYGVNYTDYQCFDLGGQSYSIRGLYDADRTWGYHHFMISNGTLTATHSFTNTRSHIRVYNTGKFIHASTCSSRFGRGAAQSIPYVYGGGEMELYGKIYICIFRGTVDPGGHLKMQPSTFAFMSAASASNGHSWLRNSGTLDLPAGLNLSGKSGVAPVEFALTQKAGTLNIGGDMKMTDTADYANFILEGGVVDVTADASFSGYHALSMPDAATATVNVSSGKTLNFAAMEYGAGTTLVKTGPGTVAIGHSAPTSLQVNEGVLRLAGETPLGSSLTLAPGTTVTFAGASTTADSIAGVEGASFTVDATVVPEGALLFTSANEGLVAAILANLGTAPAGYTFSSTATTISLAVDPAAYTSFISSGEAALAEDGGWNTGSVPAAGTAVFVAGRDTIAVLDSSTPRFGAIALTDGATLKIAGEVDALPPLRLDSSSRILFAEDSNVMFTNELTTAACSLEMSVIEIATGAVVNVGPYRNFRNADFRIYGELGFVTNVTFGTAAAGELTYLGFTADGGTLKCLATGMGTRLNWMQPTAGGRVRAPKPLVFHDAKFVPTSGSYYYGQSFGLNNPTNEPFEVIVDGCDINQRGNTSYFSGAMTMRCINGGGFRKDAGITTWGFYNEVRVQGRARFILEGEGAHLLYNHNRNYFWFEPSEPGFEQVVASNGAFVAIHDSWGNASTAAGTNNACATFVDSWWDIMRYCSPDANSWPGVDSKTWMTNAFHGFRSVNVPAGKFVGVRADNPWASGREWDRYIMLDPDAPITGGGDLVISNALTGYTFDAIVMASNNTATGEAKVLPATKRTTLWFSDGSSWAGTVVADGNVAITNRLDAPSPATVNFGSVRFAGTLPVRVWRDGAERTNDFIRVSGSLSGTGGFAPVTMDGVPNFGDSYIIGSVPLAGDATPDVAAYAGKDWKLTAIPAGDGETALLRIKYAPKGTIMLFR